MTPALTPDSTVSVKRRRVFVQPVGRHQVAALGGQLLGHAIEGKAQGADLVIVASTPAPGR